VVDGGYRFAANWRVFLGANGTHEERDHDDISGIHTNNAVGTLTYSTPLGNTVGLAVRGTQGDARVTETGGIASTADYDESEIALVVGYALGAQLRLTGRLGQTERTYDTLVGQDFDGTTYRGLVEWLPATKLTLSFEAFKILQSTLAVDATHVVREGASAGVAWAPTFKLVFSAQTPAARCSACRSATTRCVSGASPRAGSRCATGRWARVSTGASATPTGSVRTTTTRR
jgi:hypothetical protein